MRKVFSLTLIASIFLLPALAPAEGGGVSRGGVEASVGLDYLHSDTMMKYPLSAGISFSSAPLAGWTLWAGADFETVFLGSAVLLCGGAERPLALGPFFSFDPGLSLYAGPAFDGGISESYTRFFGAVSADATFSASLGRGLSLRLGQHVRLCYGSGAYLWSGQGGSGTGKGEDELALGLPLTLSLRFSLK